MGRYSLYTVSKNTISGYLCKNLKQNCPAALYKTYINIMILNNYLINELNSGKNLTKCSKFNALMGDATLRSFHRMTIWSLPNIFKIVSCSRPAGCNNTDYYIGLTTGENSGI